MIVDNLGPPDMKETLPKFQWKFWQVSDKLGERKRNNTYFFKLGLKVLLQMY